MNYETRIREVLGKNYSQGKTTKVNHTVALFLGLSINTFPHIYIVIIAHTACSSHFSECHRHVLICILIIDYHSFSISSDILCLVNGAMRFLNSGRSLYLPSPSLSLSSITSDLISQSINQSWSISKQKKMSSRLRRATTQSGEGSSIQVNIYLFSFVLEAE